MMEKQAIREQLNLISQRLDSLNFEVGKLLGAQKTTTTLIKYVILPLIIILGGLVGIKLF